MVHNWLNRQQLVACDWLWRRQLAALDLLGRRGEGLIGGGYPSPTPALCHLANCPSSRPRASFQWPFHTIRIYFIFMQRENIHAMRISVAFVCNENRFI
jgi:hypothetical protein